MIVRSLALWALFVVCASNAAAQSYQYDEQGRLIRASYSDCSTIRYFYDAAGNRTERIVLAGDGSCAGNQPPVAANDTIVLAPGATGLFDLLAAQGGGSADADPNGDTIRIVSVSQGSVPAASSGALGVQLQDDRRQVRITAPGVNGSYGFSYRIEDAFGLTDEAQVQLTVQTGGSNTPPVFTSAESASVSVGASGVFYTATASDANTGDTLSFLALTGADANRFSFNASIGGLSLAPGTPAGNYNVILRVTDSKSPAVSMALSVTVAPPPNQAPIAVDNSYTVASGSTTNFSVLGNDSDPDGDSLSLASVSGVSGGGSASRNGNQVLFIAPTGPATSSFSYTISDGRGGVDTATVTVTTSAPPNQAPIAVDNSYTVASGSTTNFSVLGNDSDPDGDSLSLASVSGVSGGGSASISGNQVLFIAPTGPATSSFSYTISDGRGGVDTATVTVTTSAPPNQAPNAVNDTYSMTAGEILVLPVLSNDTDANNDNLVVTGVSAVSGGASAQVMPDQKAVSYFAPQQAGSYTFNYTISDGQGGTDTATVTVNVTGGCGGFICLPGF